VQEHATYFLMNSLSMWMMYCATNDTCTYAPVMLCPGMGHVVVLLNI